MTDALLEPGHSILVVVFTDTVGSTAMRAEHGDRAADRVRREHDDVVADSVAQHSGAVVKGTGDGTVSVFRSALAAIGAVVDIMRRLERRNRQADIATHVRIGISAGEVLVENGDVFGTTVVQAARLCDRAETDQVLAAELVIQLAGSRLDVEVGSVGALDLKGLAQSLDTVEVRWRGAAAPQLPLPSALAPRSGPLVGRREHLDSLLHSWKLAAEGGTQTVLVTAEAGGGKSRLASELAVRVHDSGGSVLFGACDENGAYAYQPFIQALRWFVEEDAPEHPSSFGRWPADLARLVPELRSAVAGIPAAQEMEPEAARHRLNLAVASWLGAISAARPMLLVLDDLHWATEPTVAMLRELTRSKDGSLLVVALYRDTETDARSPIRRLQFDLQRGDDPPAVLPLPALDAAALGELVRAENLDTDTERMARALLDDTAGNAFFATELIRTIAAGREGELPSSVMDLVEQRVGRLAPDARDLLDVAAVAGLRCDIPMLTAATALAPMEVLGAIDAALSARLLVEVPGRQMTFGFQHALVQDAIRSRVTVTRRLRLHAAIAAALESTIGAGRNAIDIAFHYAEAASAGLDVDKAIEWCTRVADDAAAQFASADAAAWYRRAGELMRTHRPNDQVGLFELLCSCGKAEREADITSAKATLVHDAVPIARALGDYDRLSRAALEANHESFSVFGGVDRDIVTLLEEGLAHASDEQLRARMLSWLAMINWERPANERIEMTDEALFLARRSGNPDLFVEVLAQRHHVIWLPELLDLRLRDSAELLEAARRLQNPTRLALALRIRACPLIEDAQLEAAEECLEEAELLCAEVHNRPLEQYIVIGQVQTAIVRGDLSRGVGLCVGELKRATAAGDIDAFLSIGGQFVTIRAMQGRYEDVISSLDASSDDSDERGDPVFAAVLRMKIGQADVALARYDETVDRWLSEPRPNQTIGQRWMDLGYLCARFRDVANAARLIQLLEPYERVMFAPLVPYHACAYVLGLLWEVNGDLDRARGEWAIAREIYDQIGAKYYRAETDVEEASALLEHGLETDAAISLLQSARDVAATNGYGSLTMRIEDLGALGRR